MVQLELGQHLSKLHRAHHNLLTTRSCRLRRCQPCSLLRAFLVLPESWRVIDVRIAASNIDLGLSCGLERSGWNPTRTMLAAPPYQEAVCV